MDMQDLQDDGRTDLQFGEITEKIIGCAFEVINELGTGVSRIMATEIEVGLLINFGNPKLETKRFTRDK